MPDEFEEKSHDMEGLSLIVWKCELFKVGADIKSPPAQGGIGLNLKKRVCIRNILANGNACHLAIRFKTRSRLGRLCEICVAALLLSSILIHSGSTGSTGVRVKVFDYETHWKPRFDCLELLRCSLFVFQFLGTSAEMELLVAKQIGLGFLV